MNIASAETRERHAFLETAQQEFSETICAPEVIRALGQDDVDALVSYSALLFIPNIRNGRLSIPKERVGGDDIPLLGLRPGEKISYDDSVVEPTATQKESLRGIVKGWWNLSDEAAQSEVQHLINAQQGIATDSSKCFVFGNVSGALKPPRVSISVPQELNGPTNFYLDGRPVVGLRVASGYAAHITLAHELVHVSQSFAAPVIEGGSREVRATTQKSELEAYHYSATYGVALSSVAEHRKKSGMRLIEHAIIESVRLRHADPDRPFEPTEPMLKELHHKGIKWAHPDYLG
jgi:hypothetical protein